MDDEKAREPVHYPESPSWPGMCISIELSFIIVSCYVISYYLVHLDIFYSLTTTPKSVCGKHPDLFRKFSKHLIVELGMCKNTHIWVWSFEAFRPGLSISHIHHIDRRGHFTLKQN